MATIHELKRRIRSVKSIGQVTRAMEAVSASKMRRAQQSTLASRAYAEKAREILSYLASQPGAGKALHPLLEPREGARIAVVLITPDRGLCGALISTILRKTTQYMQEQTDTVQVISVGRKGRDFMLRYGANVVAEFTDLPDIPRALEIGPIARVVIDDFLANKVDRVYLSYTDFVNTLVQRPMIMQLLPLEPAPPERRLRAAFEIEPDPTTVLDEVLPSFTEMQVYQAFLESRASEHSARMVAMRNATENAKELTTDLTLTFNKVRQQIITREILDIAGGAEALSQAQQR